MPEHLEKANALDSVFKAASALQKTHPAIKFIFIGDAFLKNQFQETYKNLDNINLFSQQYQNCNYSNALKYRYSYKYMA